MLDHVVELSIVDFVIAAHSRRRQNLLQGFNICEMDEHFLDEKTSRRWKMVEPPSFVNSKSIIFAVNINSSHVIRPVPIEVIIVQ